MKSLAHSVTGLSGITVLLASLLSSGCGTHLVAGAVGAKSGSLATRSAVNSLMHARPLARPLTDKSAVLRLQTLGKQLAAKGVDLPAHMLKASDAAEGDAPAAGPTPVPAPAKAAAPAKADNVDALLSMMTAYGYDGDRDHMVNAIHDVTFQYPLDNRDPGSPYFAPKGWDNAEYGMNTDDPSDQSHSRLDTHFCYWLPNFDVPVNNPDDYATQALTIAQSRTDVRYYVWVSKPSADFWPNQPVPPQGACAAPAPVSASPNPNPFATVMSYAPIFTQAGGFNIVKSVNGFGWMVNIRAKSISPDEKIGVIQDYFELPSKFYNPTDLGNLVPIPVELYF